MLKLKTVSVIYGNPIEISIVRDNHFRVLRSLKATAYKPIAFYNYSDLTQYVENEDVC